MKSRPAVVGDKLIVSQLNFSTRGLVEKNDPDTAVCLLPGTEVSYKIPGESEPRTGTFVLLNGSDIFLDRHNNALRLGEDNATPTRINNLDLGSIVSVLQLPAPKIEAKAEEPKPEREPEPDQVHETFFA